MEADSYYDKMSWRDLHQLAKDRNIEGAKRKVGLTKEVLVELLMASDGKKATTHEPEKPSTTRSSLADLLKPNKSESTLSFSTPGGKGADITDMFLDVKSAEQPSTRQSVNMEADSVDGIIPSVAVDKFHLAADMLTGPKCLGILLGHEHKFGKGTKSFKRNVVTTMVCGLEEQLTGDSGC